MTAYSTEYAAGWLDGHDAGHDQADTEGRFIADGLRGQLAAAWAEGYATGHHAGRDEAREDQAAALAQLAEAHGEIDQAWRRFATVRHAERVRRDVEAMEAFDVAGWLADNAERARRRDDEIRSAAQRTQQRYAPPQQRAAA